MTYEEAVLLLSGASQMEELEESAVEVFENFRSHPVAINCCPKSRLLSCGLLSRYQVASLLDYRQRCGDVLSVTELGAVDGFGGRTAEALRYFVTFEGTASRPRTGVRQSLTVKGSGRLGGADTSACGGLKYHLEAGDRVEFNWCDRTTYSDRSLGIGSIGAAYYGKKWPGKVIVGDYNARFGQGLLMWTGFSLSGVSSAQALWRNGTGLSTSKSFTTPCRGVAADCNLGSWCLSLAFDLASGGARGILNMTRTGKIWQAGVTGLVEEGRWGLSADTRIGFGGGAFFGEVALERREGVSTALACVVGAFWVPAYGTTLSGAVRAYPASFSGLSSAALRSSTKTSDEYGASLAFQSKTFLLTADAAHHPSKGTSQVKLISQFKPELALGTLTLTPVLKGSAKYTFDADGGQSLRVDLRSDVSASLGAFCATVRVNAVHCRDYSLLSYVEAGWKGKFAAYIRVTSFRVDNWDDRIYVYERDAPGSFNVPACYGRGWMGSLVAGVKLRERHSLWLRASAVDYPKMEDKAGKCEVKLQYTLSLASSRRKRARE